MRPKVYISGPLTSSGNERENVLAAADALIRLPGESGGADAEVDCARALGIPVFCSIQRLLGHFTLGAVA